MNTEPTTPDLKALWRGQSTEGTPVALEDIKARATKFQTRVRHRNLREYIAAAFVVVVFGWYAWSVPSPAMRAGAVLSILAALFVVWQLHRRGSARTPSPEASAVEIAAFHRGELVRQRDALKSVGLWYLAPFAPGSALMILGRYFQLHAPGRSLERDHAIIIVTAMFVALVFGGVWLLNLYGASRLQRRIDALDRLRTE